MKIDTDICVIGAGSGGLSVAAGAVQMGARVVLIEAGEMGGDCLNAGCVPSKALIAAAKAAEAQRHGFCGVPGIAPQVDFGAVKDHVAAVVDQIAPVDSQERFEGLGCTVIRAFARFTGPREVQAGDTTIRARRFVIATGSRPFVPPIQGVDTTPYLTNETIFALRERPEHLVVIGGGPIGVELAQAHRRLGCEVTVIEGAQVLGREDPELAAVVIDQLRAEGVRLLEGQPVVKLAGTPGAVEVTLGDGKLVKGSHLLMAVGRKVSLDGLGLDQAGIAHTPKGITVNAALRSTTNRRVYAVGDVAGGLQFTHVAGWHAGIVVRQIVLGLPAKADPRAIPRATYTDPELAHVGLTEAEARKAHGAALTVVRAEFHHNDRAQAEGKSKGLIKVMIVKGRPVGASIAGPQAGELIGLWSLAISAKLKMTAIAGMVAPYPTLGEVSKRAASAYFSPKLFESPTLKRFVRFVQRWVP
ncbi:MAG: FAD-dependent oxidoreductase [Tabrizicola sp.]|jgi:pyruvate/2-oxoglutarate dehydrogenase complex dihydrolipoamide dehydrogenase (E3) component|nr:FAD-dependent oxidoreductase [Tabrizicola sp.]